MAHVFVSYVRDNVQQVDRLCRDLREAGIDVWLDRDQIAPGERWQEAIRHAIQSGAFFIACFSHEYLAKDRTYMNEELLLAIDELRKRPTDRTWFVPVLLSDCTVPARAIGGGETLQDIQWVDLHGDWEGGVRRIIKVVQPAMQSRFLRSPWLGSEFWQGDTQCALLDAGSGLIRVVLRPKPFEIRLPRAPKNGWVKICASYDPAIFSEVEHGVARESVRFLRKGTGMADAAFGSGALFVNDNAHMHLDWGGRLLPQPEGGGRVLFHSVYKVRQEEPAIPKGKDVFAVIHVGDASEPLLQNWNFERFILSF